MADINTTTEYEFWNVSQLQAVGLSPKFATSFNYFVRDVSTVSSNVGSVNTQVESNSIKITQNEADILTNQDNIEANRLEITANLEYLNGTTKPADYVEETSYTVGEYTTFANKEYKCIANTTGVFAPASWELLGVVPGDEKVSSHIAETSAHGVTGDIVGNEDYCTEILGGVVDLAALIADLTEITTADLLAAPATYDQTYTQLATNLTNENKAKINEIVAKVNAVLAGQITAKQMSAT